MSGAASDMETSNRIAHAMVSMYGMSDKVHLIPYCSRQSQVLCLSLGRQSHLRLSFDLAIAIPHIEESRDWLLFARENSKPSDDQSETLHGFFMRYFIVMET